ncbi:glycoside hydrolase family 3 protein [Streptococcus merionis]|uniref:glycoside hydrolase family 3 protein n=1 Tax=Streptococcus merionis TaxID=400065 RepID=UPI0026F359E1|nr:glycoside hydrolase family 3 N-terminal domain-containing protein [Streptococcus merionis]
MDLTKRPFYLSNQDIFTIETQVKHMSDEEKIGQLFCLLGSIYSDDELDRLVTDYHVGVFLFRPLPLKELEAKWARLDSLTKYPLVKAANLEEGGIGANSQGTYFANPLQIAAADDNKITEYFATICAVEGIQAGCNWNFAPVSDIDFNYLNPITNVRTFGSDPDKVAEHVATFVKTSQKVGMAVACKHFPGDGVDYRDQHLHPTYNTLSVDDWYASYGNVYQATIKEDLLSIMVGHIVQPALEQAIDPEKSPEDYLPASQSKALLSGILRGELDFNGLIITDATIMGGYTMTMPRKEALTATINAGCDMFCFSTDVYEDMTYLKEALVEGCLDRQRLDEAVIRILAFKTRLEQLRTTTPQIDVASWRREAADKAITLIKDTQNLIPVTQNRFPKIRLSLVGHDELSEGGRLSQVARDYLVNKGYEVSFYEPLNDDLHGTANLPQDTLNLILVNCPPASNQTTVRINWSSKHALDMPRYVEEETYAMISFNNPYHLQDAPRIPTYINAYSPTKDTIEASLEKLLGQSDFKGISPVDAFCGLVDTHF